jgi:polyisoprenoid-binding protein YceI
MRTNHFFLAAALLLPFATNAQVRYSTRTGEVSFFSATPAENIEAVNHKATCVFDVTTGQVEISMLMKAFEFEKALMQEHFNENYMESNTYPKATFKGKVTGITPEDLTKPGMKEVTIEGDLTMHGVTQHRTFKAMLTIDPSGSMIKTSCDFVIKPEDHKISIPSVVRGQIAEEIQVKVRIDLQKM